MPPKDSRSRFSCATARRVTALLARRGVLTVTDISEELSLSRMTVGRVLSTFESERTVRRLAYRPFSGRGAKPERYILHPKTSVAVIDIRAGEYAVSVFSVPSFKVFTVFPKIRDARPDDDKAALIIDECVPLVVGEIPEKYLLALAVLTDEGADVPRAPGLFSGDTFYMTKSGLVPAEHPDGEPDIRLLAAKRAIDLYETNIK